MDDQPQMIRVYPKSNCPRCYGRGYMGEMDGCRVECSCLTRRKAHIPPKGSLEDIADLKSDDDERNIFPLKDAIAALRGGIPARCDFCGTEAEEDDMEPEEGGQWACSTCWRRFRAWDRAVVEDRYGRG